MNIESRQIISEASARTSLSPDKSSSLEIPTTSSFSRSNRPELLHGFSLGWCDASIIVDRFGFF
jgi:hypothetical protein